MEEEIKIEDSKIQLSAEEFIKAMKNGKAIDKNGVEIQFNYMLDSNTYRIANVYVESALIINQTFEKKIFLIDSTIGNLNFLGCTFSSTLLLHNTTIESDFNISDTSISSLELQKSNLLRMFIAGKSTFDIFNIEHCTFNNDLSVSDKSSLNLFNLNDSVFLGKLFIRGTVVNVMGINRCKFNIIFVPKIKEKGVLTIIESQFKSLWTIPNFFNLGYMQWNNLNPAPDSLICIANATMGKWDIVNCDFSESRFTIYSSKISDAFYTNTKFPAKLTPFKGANNENDILRDGYNQLKTLAQKQNDRKIFLHYQAAELSSYNKTLHWWKNFRTKFQLSAMWISNDYGTSWGRGVLFTVITTAVCMAICYWNYWPTFGKESFWAYAGKYGEFLFSVVKKPEFVHAGFQTAIYYFSRIPLAFGIYQTIAAFRKFGKSE